MRPMLMREGFLDRRRLLHGPWQAFERDVARLMVQNEFADVRVVGGTGDRGADVLGVKGGQLWVFQCKHSTSSPPPRGAVAEVVEAGRFYKAQRLVVAVSRPPTDAFHDEIARFQRQGLQVEVATPDAVLNLLARSPEYSTQHRELREYQREAADLLRESLVDTGRGQIVLATGLGKTVVMAEVVADLFRDNLVPHQRALVLAHTRELVDQLHRSFWLQLPKWLPTQQFVGGERPTDWDGLVFGTVQSVFSSLETMPPLALHSHR